MTSFLRGTKIREYPEEKSFLRSTYKGNQSKLFILAKVYSFIK